MVAARSVAREQKASKGERCPEYGRETVEPHVRSASWQVFRVEAVAADRSARLTRQKKKQNHTVELGKEFHADLFWKWAIVYELLRITRRRGA